MGQYDIALKHLLRSGGRMFLARLGIRGSYRTVDLELPSARERRVDFLAETGAGHLLHVEFQIERDPAFAFRMLGYCSEILERLNDEAKSARKRIVRAELRQLLVYVGAGVWAHSAEIVRPNLSYRFDVLNVSEIEATELVRDGDLSDSVLAVLCKDGASRATIVAILTRIADARPMDKADALAQLLILAKLRKAKGLVEKEYKAMGITVSVEDIPLLREPIDRAMREGEARGRVEGLTVGLERVLRRRFGVAVPADLVEQLSKLPPEALLEMFDRVDSANTLAEVLGNHIDVVKS